MDRRENAFKKNLVKIMGTRWDVQSHEDRLSEGIPDLSYGVNSVNGWIELKQIKDWPKTPTTPAKPDKFTAQQVNWLLRRGKKGGNCFIFVKVGRNEYFLFGSESTRMVQRGMTKKEYHYHCLKKWYPSVDPDQLVDLLGF